MVTVPLLLLGLTWPASIPLTAALRRLHSRSRLAAYLCAAMLCPTTAAAVSVSGFVHPLTPWFYASLLSLPAWLLACILPSPKSPNPPEPRQVEPDDAEVPTTYPNARDGHRRLSSTEAATASALRTIDPHLAGLFERGLQLADDIDAPGTGYLVAHVGRELSRAIVLSLTGTTPVHSPSSRTSSVTNFRTNIAAALGLPEAHPQVRDWFRAHQTLVSNAHWRQSPPSSDDVRDSLASLAGSLFGRIAPYFDTQAELDALLRVPAPSPTDLERLRRCTIRYAQRQYFFSRFARIDWLLPLADAGYFRNPPERVLHTDGSWSLQHWPEGNALARFAATAPDVVVNQFLSIPSDNSNPAVWNCVATATESLQPAHASRLVPHLLAALKHAPPVLFPYSLVGVIPRLASAGEHDEAFQLTDMLLFVKSSDTPKKDPARAGLATTTDILVRLDDFEFSDLLRIALPALETADSVRALRLLAKKLNLALRATASDLYPGHSSLWCRVLDRPDEMNSARCQLARATARIALRAASDPQETDAVFEILERYDHEIFQRIRLHVLAACGPLAIDRLNAFFRSPTSLEPPFRYRETAAVVREQFQNASEDARRAFQHALEAGPTDPPDGTPQRGTAEQRWQRRRLIWFRDRIPTGLRDLAARLGVTAHPPTPEDEGLAEDGFYVDAGFVGEQSPVSVEQLHQMDSGHFVDYLTTWRPDTTFYASPTQDGLHQSLVEYGTGEPVEAMQRCRQLTHAAPGTGHIVGYLRCLLNGIRRPIDGGTPIDPIDALQLLQDLVTYVNARIDQHPTDTTHHKLCERLGTEIADFLTTTCRHNSFLRGHNDTLWMVAEEIMRSVPNWESYQNEEIEAFSEVLNAATNGLAGRATEMLFEVALVTFRNSLGAPESLATGEQREAAKVIAFRRLRPLLEPLLGRVGRGGVSARTVIGTHVPLIHWFDREWLIDTSSALFGNDASDPWNHSAWVGFIARARFYRSVFADLRPWYLRAAAVMPTALERTNAFNTDWAPTKHFAEHVFASFIGGVIGIHDNGGLLATVFRYLPGSERSHISWSVFRSWSDSVSPVSGQCVDRLVQFWRWRLDQLEGEPESEARQEDLRGLTWFVCTPYVPDAEAIALGLRTLRASGGKTVVRGAVWERLVLLADIDASETFRMAELLLRAALDHPYPHIRPRQAQQVLRLALTDGDAEIQARATGLIHTLGERGYVEFGQLLDGLE